MIFVEAGWRGGYNGIRIYRCCSGTRIHQLMGLDLIHTNKPSTVTAYRNIHTDCSGCLGSRENVWSAMDPDEWTVCDSVMGML